MIDPFAIGQQQQAARQAVRGTASDQAAAAELPSLFDYMLELYLASTRENRMEPLLAVDFAKWAVDWLTTNRPRGVFYVGGLIGLELGNDARVLVGRDPTEELAGGMLTTPLGDAQAHGVPAAYAKVGAVPMGPRRRP